MNFLKAHLNKILNVLWLAAPVVAGVVSGGVFTAPVLIAAGGALAGKLAQSPVNHQAMQAEAKADR